MLDPGHILGKYVLRRKLGSGGFGVVFVAEDTTLGRDVAIKLLRTEHTASSEVVKRFIQEARSAAKVVHPGIVTVFECGQITDGPAYIAMELLAGETVSDRLLRRGPMPPHAVFEIARQVASALDAAHRAGVIHRDLKPENLFLVRDPAAQGGERVKILDFGIAKLADPTTQSNVHTQSMMIFGTPRYMSPEQCRSAASVDQRSDIYMLGCILYELLAGHPPFDGQPGELIAYHLMVDPAPITAHAPETPRPLAELVHQMLAKEPLARPATMADVVQRLDMISALVGSVAPTLPPGATPLPMPSADTIPSHPPMTTLSSLAGASVARVSGGSGRAWPIWIAAALIVIAVPIAVVIGLRSGDEDTPVQPPPAKVAVAQPPPPAVAQPSQPAPPPAAPVQQPVQEPVDDRSAPRPSGRGAETPYSEAKRKPARRAEAAARPQPPAAAEPQTGTLALAVTPACEIFVDGASVGRATQRELALPVGRHKIVLVDSAKKIHDSFSVDIKAGATERIAKEYPVTEERDETINPFARGTR